jgi:hypothetical protein
MLRKFAIIYPVNGSPHNPLIIAFIGDLLFSSRLEDAAEKQGFKAILIENASYFCSRDPEPLAVQHAEHTFGPGAILEDKISAWLPALIIFDLNNQAVPWRNWIALLKSAPATRRIPVICFGSHKEAGALKSARDAGADAVFSRSRFVQDLTEILSKHVRKFDRDELLESCQMQLSSLALQGFELFNQQDYFEAHERLEEAWIEDQSPGRELYRAVLQIAIAYLQIQRQNYTGALKMFLRLRQWIEPLPDECRGVDVENLRKDAQAVYQQLIAAGREKVVEFDQTLFKPVIFRI